MVEKVTSGNRAADLAEAAAQNEEVTGALSDSQANGSKVSSKQRASAVTATDHPHLASLESATQRGLNAGSGAPRTGRPWPPTPLGLLKKNVDPADYGGEFNYVGAKRAKQFGLEPEDPKLRTYALTAEEQRLNTLEFDHRGKARLPSKKALTDTTARYSLDPERGEFVVIPETNYTVTQNPDGTTRRKELVGRVVLPEYWVRNPNTIVELVQHSTGLGTKPVFEDGVKKLDKFGKEILQPLESAMAGYLTFSEEDYLREITDFSGHYKHGVKYMLQAVELLAKKGALFDMSVADVDGQQDEIDWLIYDTVENKREQIQGWQEEREKKLGEVPTLQGPAQADMQREIQGLQEKLEPYEGAIKYLSDRDIKPTHKLSTQINVEVYEDGEVNNAEPEEFLRTGGGNYIQARKKEAVLQQLKEKYTLKPPIDDGPKHEGYGRVAPGQPLTQPQKLKIYLNMVDKDHDSITSLERSLMREAFRLFHEEDQGKAFEYIQAALNIEPPEHPQDAVAPPTAEQSAALVARVKQDLQSSSMMFSDTHADEHLARLRTAGQPGDALAFIDNMIAAYQAERMALPQSKSGRHTTVLLELAGWLVESSKEKQASGDHQTALANSLEALNLLQKSADLDATLSYPGVEAAALLSIAESFLALGKLHSAGEAARAVLTVDSYSFSNGAKINLSVSKIMLQLNDFDEAEKLCLRSIERCLISTVHGGNFGEDESSSKVRDGLKEAVSHFKNVKARKASGEPQGKSSDEIKDIDYHYLAHVKNFDPGNASSARKSAMSHATSKIFEALGDISDAQLEQDQDRFMEIIDKTSPNRRLELFSLLIDRCLKSPAIDGNLLAGIVRSMLVSIDTHPDSFDASKMKECVSKVFLLKSNERGQSELKLQLDEIKSRTIKESPFISKEIEEIYLTQVKNFDPDRSDYADKRLVNQAAEKIFNELDGISDDKLNRGQHEILELLDKTSPNQRLKLFTVLIDRCSRTASMDGNFLIGIIQRMLVLIDKYPGSFSSLKMSENVKKVISLQSDGQNQSELEMQRGELGARTLHVPRIRGLI